MSGTLVLYGDGTRALLSAADHSSHMFSFDYTLHFPRALDEIRSMIFTASAGGSRVADWKLVLKNATELTAADVDTSTRKSLQSNVLSWRLGYAREPGWRARWAENPLTAAR